jgi:hypothetical protein
MENIKSRGSFEKGPYTPFQYISLTVKNIKKEQLGIEFGSIVWEAAIKHSVIEIFYH